MAAIFDFQHIQTSNSVLTNLYVLPDPANVGIAVEIMLLSIIWADIYVIFLLRPVNDRHLWFQTYPDVGQYSC